jgi:DNA-binding NarL/FixJ family response regulator
MLKLSALSGGKKGEPRRLVQPRARVVIAEDHPIMREGLIYLLENEPGMELVGCAESAREVEDLLRLHDVDTLVLDLTLGSDDGLELAQRVLIRQPGLRIVVLSVREDLVYADRLLSMGAMAYVTKDRTQSEFLRAMRSAVKGRVYLTEQQRQRRDSRTHAAAAVSPERVLSARELAVLRLLATGKTAVVIAQELSLAPKTVYSHRRNIGSKLGIPSGRPLLRYAVHWVGCTVR